ncbi:MFS transporter [Kitasatospora kifunensis]|uniref:MFS family permease n=1 Tax=Kitasatospora kifunensis TaxID=58351 RepID=A0A7W7R3S5_KITKI|nr:MFS transporter [Kitasatospora kifunensis]MBB4924948.1 MFS family permease [Kitasatospora kifunensis]
MTEPTLPGGSRVGDDPEAAPPRWWSWLAAWPVAAVFVLSNAATPLYALWQRDIGFGKGTLTVIFACYIAGLIGSLLVCGVLSDRIGRKRVLVPAVLLALLACGVFAAADSVPALMLARLLTGIAVGAAVSAGMAAVTEVAGAARRRLAALLASCAMVLGAGTGPLLAGVFSQELPGPTSTVFVVVAVLLLGALLVVLRMPLPPREAAVAGGPRIREPRIRVPRVPRGNGRQLVLGIAVFAPGITATSFVLSLGPALLASLLGGVGGGGSRILAGAVAFAMFLAATGVQFAVRRLSRRVILLAGAASTALAMFALVAAVRGHAVALLVVAALLAGAGQGLGQFGGLSLLNANVPAHCLAEANAALNVGGYLLAGTLPVAAGFLGDAIGLTGGTTVFGATLMLLAVLGGALVVVKRSWVKAS